MSDLLKTPVSEQELDLVDQLVDEIFEPIRDLFKNTLDKYPDIKAKVLALKQARNQAN